MTNNMDIDGGFQNIELSLPVDAAYVSAARQTALSIASRMGFDAGETEDVKTAVSEACTYVIKKLTCKCGDRAGSFNSGDSFTLIFSLRNDCISIKLSCAAHGLSADTDNDYSLILIKGLMDSFEFIDKDGSFEIVMSKRHNMLNMGLGR